jgi:hypothetical protein
MAGACVRAAGRCQAAAATRREQQVVSPGELDRFYDMPATVTAVLAGGPFDGQTTSFPEVLLHSSLYPQLVLPMPASFILAELSGPPRPLERAYYQARRDGFGFVQRDDEGRVTFAFERQGRW